MAIGDLVATLSVPGETGASFQLVDNPGGLFAVSGGQLIQAVDVPSGNYPVTIQAQFQGQVLTQSFVVDHLPFPPPPPPPPPLTSSIAVVPSALSAGETATVYFTWNDIVIDFTPGAVAVTGGSIGSLTEVSPTLYTAVFTPTPSIVTTATLQVQQSGTGGAVYFNAAGSTTTASNVVDISVDTFSPGKFFISVNLTGGNNPNPSFASAACINFYANRLNKSGPFRLVATWSATSPQFGITGYQHTSFGPLDTTAAGYVLTGTNLLYNSSLPASSPWQTFIVSPGVVTITNNSGTDPIGGNGAALAVFNKPSSGAFTVLFQNYTGGGAGLTTNSVWLKASTGADVGKVLELTLFADVASAVQLVTLTSGWVRYSTTGVLPSATRYAWQLGQLDGAASSGIVNVLIYGAQTNLGNLATYQPTVAGYVQAIDQVVTDVAAAGMQCFIDIHTFGVGPNGLVGGGTSVAAFADLWGKIAAHYVANPNLLAAIFGFDLMNEWPNGFDSSVIFDASQSAINSIRAAGFTGYILIEGTNFSSAWNWLTGDGQPFNSSQLYLLIDPLNKLIMSPHMYPDWDDSGSHYSYSDNLATPGTAPVGLNVNPTIGVERMDREYGPWARQHGVTTILGEYGSSNDSPWRNGDFDYADWNAITRNLLAYLQANKMGINLWSAGPGFPAGYNQFGYAYSLDPYSIAFPSLPDFTSTGVQHPAMVVLDEFTGYSGSQPQAYAIFQPGLTSPQRYCTVGTATPPFTVYYGGLVSTPQTITPHAFLSDGVTSAGGTFTPSSLSVQAGENFLGSFVYTASQQATILISATNSAGWANPPPIGISSIVDGYVGLPGIPSNIYGMFNRYTPNIGPALQLQRSTDGQIMDWYLTLPNSMGYNGFDRVAIQAWASARSGISVLKRYDMSGSGNDLTFSGGTLPTLNLQNTAGYPEINYTSGCQGVFNTPINGQTQFYTIARFNQSAGSAGGIYRMDWFNGPIRWGASGSDTFEIIATGQPPPTPPVPQFSVDVALSFGLVTGAYHDYGISYASGATNGFATYKDGTQIASATTTYIIGADFQTSVNFASFRFGSAFFVGSDYNVELGMGFTLTGAQQANIASIDAAYYSTALPDTLPAIPPSIAGIISNLPIFPGLIPARPFGAITITDTNGGATETVTITLSGAVGTLSGSGISGSGPYTVGPDTPANVSSILNGVVFTTAAGVGSATSFALLVTSSAGGSTSNNSTSTIVTTYSPQASFSPPAGTFTPLNHSGWNLVGGESSAWPAFFPVTSCLDYISAKGMGLCRLVLSSQWWYTTSFGQFDPTYLGKIKAFIDYAFTKNIYVLIDPHNSGFIWDASIVNPSRGDHFFFIQPNTRSQDLFQDFWRRIATSFLNYPNVVFGLMNEPTQIATAWRDGGVTPPITAIRAVGATQLILIPGTGQSSALGWASNGNTAAFASYAGDPLNNSAFEAHQYLDAGASGGSPIATLNGSTILNTFNSFLTANTFKGFVGEFGMGWTNPWYPINPSGDQHYDPTQANPENTNSVSHNSDMLTVVTTSGLYIGWSAWAGGRGAGGTELPIPRTAGAYFFQVEPERDGSGNITFEQPQIPTLQSFIM